MYKNEQKTMNTETDSRISHSVLLTYIDNVWKYNILELQFYKKLYSVILESNISYSTIDSIWDKIFHIITTKFNKIVLKYTIKGDILEYCQGLDQALLLLINYLPYLVLLIRDLDFLVKKNYHPCKRQCINNLLTNNGSYLTIELGDIFLQKGQEFRTKCHADNKIDLTMKNNLKIMETTCQKILSLENEIIEPFHKSITSVRFSKGATDTKIYYHNLLADNTINLDLIEFIILFKRSILIEENFYSGSFKSTVYDIFKLHMFESRDRLVSFFMEFDTNPKSYLIKLDKITGIDLYIDIIFQRFHKAILCEMNLYKLIEIYEKYINSFKDITFRKSCYMTSQFKIETRLITIFVNCVLRFGKDFFNALIIYILKQPACNVSHYLLIVELTAKNQLITEDYDRNLYNRLLTYKKYDPHIIKEEELFTLISICLPYKT